MRTHNTFIISHPADIPGIAKRLAGRGVIDVKLLENTADSSSALYIKSGRFFDPLTRLFASQKTRQSHGDRICSHLKTVLGNAQVPKWLTDNIKAQVMATGGLTGDFLARNLEAFNAGGALVPLGSAPPVAASRGQQVRIMTGDPMAIPSDLSLVSSDTALEAMNTASDNRQADKRDQMSATQLGLWENRQGRFEDDASPTFKFTFSASQAENLLSFRGSSELEVRLRKPRDLYDLIRNGVGRNTGAIVVEPQPDTLEKMKPGYSDAGLKAQIRAALDCVADAKTRGVDRVITFASMDNELLQRIKTLYPQVEKDRLQATSTKPMNSPPPPGSGKSSGIDDGFSDISLNDDF